MKKRIKAALGITVGAKRRHEKLHNGNLVRYTGRHLSAEAQHYMKSTRIVHNAIYTVAHSVDDGATVWLFVQELPGVRLYSEAFVQTPHLAEDHWEIGSLSEHGTASHA
jgi:hypothetical protein